MFHKLWLKHFRNLDEVVLDFQGHRHIYICGRNNQGKTNFLESLYYLGNGVSPVDVEHAHLVRFDSESATIGGDVGDGDDSFRVYFKIDSNGERSGMLDGATLKQLRMLRKRVSVEFLSADVIRIFQDYSDHRRKDLNRFCSTIFSEYADIEKRYSRVLRQKNQLIKKRGASSQVNLWNQQLLQLAYPLLKYRLDALQLITLELQPLLHHFNSDFNTLNMPYLAKELVNWDKDIDLYIECLSASFERVLEKEYHVGYSLAGPHRDDFGIELNGRNLFDFFSRGINRSVAVLLKVAQLGVLRREYGGFPVLLLDDTFAEIDRQNKAELFDIIKPLTQLFYVSVDPEDCQFFGKDACWVMEDGCLKNG